MIGLIAERAKKNTKLPFDMFRLAQTASEAKRYTKLRNIYHRGQELAWDGRDVLGELLEKHGPIQISDEKKRALSHVFEILLWGEMAAWKISAALAEELVPLEAKMAATSQAHDEARHFYVLYDYLTQIDYKVKEIDPYSQRVLDLTLNTKKLSRKLLGMQLMIETIALTIFKAVREKEIEPVLSELITYYEKDEARHVGIGTQYLPGLLKQQSLPEAIATVGFQLKLVFWAWVGLKSMEKDLHTLGISAIDLNKHGRELQVAAYRELWADSPHQAKVTDFIMRMLMAIETAIFPGIGNPSSLKARMTNFWKAFWSFDLIDAK